MNATHVAMMYQVAGAECPFPGLERCGFLRVCDVSRLEADGDTCFDEMETAPGMLFFPDREGWREAWRWARKLAPGLKVLDFAPDRPLAALA